MTQNPNIRDFPLTMHFLEWHIFLCLCLEQEEVKGSNQYHEYEKVNLEDFLLKNICYTIQFRRNKAYR